MSLELPIAGIALCLLVATARGMSRGRMGAGPPTMPVQFGLGLLCGAIGAVLAAVPFTDAIPDRWEGTLMTGLIAVSIALAVGLAVRRARRRPEQIQESIY